MEFINAEEFSKQPKEIQKVFLDWWDPSIGDLISFKVCLNDVDLEDEPVTYALKDEDDKPNKLKDTPLFTEGQLRQFIQDKTGGKLKIIELDGANYNIVGEHKTFVNIDSDLLQAYWKVALEIAKECIPKFGVMKQ